MYVFEEEGAVSPALACAVLTLRFLFVCCCLFFFNLFIWGVACLLACLTVSFCFVFVSLFVGCFVCFLVGWVG